ncbi:hypothetical protein Bca4012_019763 [Brassica carinata]|uniref:Uncharacterized protein n=1 Tax=Brassica carinata TaxID=52824 RepID=A0A8X8BA30_BRACI|nr:hypothetical protein Bca52824_001834 [Brassica carinata]
MSSSVVGSSPTSLPGRQSSGVVARRVEGRSVGGLFRGFSKISLRSGQIYYVGGLFWVLVVYLGGVCELLLELSCIMFVNLWFSEVDPRASELVHGVVDLVCSLGGGVAHHCRAPGREFSVALYFRSSSLFYSSLSYPAISTRVVVTLPASCQNQAAMNLHLRQCRVFFLGESSSIREQTTSRKLQIKLLRRVLASPSRSFTTCQASPSGSKPGSIRDRDARDLQW